MRIERPAEMTDAGGDGFIGFEESGCSGKGSVYVGRTLLQSRLRSITTRQEVIS